MPASALRSARVRRWWRPSGARPGGPPSRQRRCPRQRGEHFSKRAGSVNGRGGSRRCKARQSRPWRALGRGNRTDSDDRGRPPMAASRRPRRSRTALCSRRPMLPQTERPSRMSWIRRRICSSLCWYVMREAPKRSSSLRSSTTSMCAGARAPRAACNREAHRLRSCNSDGNVAEARWHGAVADVRDLQGLPLVARWDAVQAKAGPVADGVAARPEPGRDAAIGGVLEDSAESPALDLQPISQPKRNESR